MNRACVITLCLASVASSSAQPVNQKPTKFDLSKLGMVIDGEQECNDTGNRLQDFPSPVMDQIIAAGPNAMQILIGLIADRRMAKTKEPLICYWPGMAVGDIAFVLLIDLCTDTGRRTTVPGADWTDLLGPGNDAAAWEQLHGFIKRRGSRALQDRWRVVWNKYRRQVSWDSKERCFKLKAN